MADEAVKEAVDESSDDGVSPLANLIETMKSVHEPDKIIEKSFFNILLIVIFGLPYLGHVEGWVSGWGYVWLPLLHVAVACICVEIIKSIAPIFRTTKPGLTVSHGVALAVMFSVLYLVWAPLKSTLIGSCVLMALFLILVPLQVKRDRLTASKMRLSADLQAELKALPETPLHPQVDTILQRVASERAELQRVLNDSLKDDVAIDGLGILREYDAGFADILDRAHPLTTLLKQAQSGSTAAQDQSEDGLKVLRSVSDGIHNLAVSVLGYAGSRNSQALDDLKHRTEDLRAARKAHDEIDAHVDPS